MKTFLFLFQEQLRRRQEAQERILQQNEFRRASIRGSRKLQALQDSPLQDRPVGIENDAYAEDEEVEVIAGLLHLNYHFNHFHLHVTLDVNKCYSKNYLMCCCVAISILPEGNPLLFYVLLTIVLAI